jgi:hypothetical protein
MEVVETGRVTFKNPNDPVQPAEGVYHWFYVARRREITFYVGQAGEREHGLVSQPSTLARGVSQLQRSTGLSANEGRTLTTRFIVGTAIKYLTENGYDCIWEHICDNPGEERNLCQEHNPILQDGNVRILERFKLSRRDRTPWNSRDEDHVREAEERLYSLFAEVFKA